MRVPDEVAGDASRDSSAGDHLETTLRRLFDGQPYGVLCTQGQGQSYGSLVAFAMTPGLDSAIFATQKATRKYQLLSQCAHVAFVVDNRSALPDQFMDVEAVTATGLAHEVPAGPEFEQWARLLTDRHAYLDTFVHSVSCGLFRIEVVRYFHVSRFQEVRQWDPVSRA